MDVIRSLRPNPTSALDGLVSPYGVATSVEPARVFNRGLGRLFAMNAVAGAGIRSAAPAGRRVKGSGRTMAAPSLARLTAIAEAAERYAAGDFLKEERVHATPAELDGPVLDPARYPRCSAAEYADPRCPVVPFDPGAAIRWVRGLELTSGEPMWVPAVMATYRLHDPAPAERFNYRISTGYSVHTDPVEALVGGICEVIERDAVALTWLQRLALPLVGAEVGSENLDYLMGWAERHFIRVHRFDATTDLGVPTVYCLLVADHDDRARNIVACATGRTMSGAAEKALIEGILVRGLYHASGEAEDDVAKFTTVEDGARYMGKPEHAEAFDFLTDGATDRPRSRREALPDDPAAMLDHLVGLFRDRGTQVVVVDRTPQELADAGLTCVSVVIPDLQPMSLLPLAQFRAHPRLYDAPARMGHPVLSEEEQNTWPQPFA